MVTLQEISRSKPPIIAEVDILVTGGGTAGAVAAIAGGRTGKTTMVVEQNGYLGGTQTGALVTPMMPNQIDKIPLNGGIDAEINARLNAMNESGVWKDGNRGWFNPETLKYVLEQMAIDAGARLLYYTMFEDAVIDGERIIGCVFLNKSGRGWIRAKRVIDCTGDADVSFRAGVPFESGDPETSLNQPFSLRFHLGNVDVRKFGDYLASLGKHDFMESAEGAAVPLLHTAMVWNRGWTLEPVFRKAVADGVLKESDGDYFQIFSIAGRPHELAFNCPRIALDVDGTNPFHLTKAAVTGREIVQRYVRFCREYLPGFEGSYLVLTAPMIGVRESRRIKGEYFLTTEDVLGGRKFEDAVCRNCYPLDIHRDSKMDKLKLVQLPPGEYHEVPYRSLVPLNVDNLLVAGRCLSASFEAQSSVRIQSNCRAMGEAAAVASAMSIDDNCPPRKLDGVRLRTRLRELGGRL